jgi:hypothetical protein
MRDKTLSWTIWAAITFLPCLAHAPIARAADSASCLEKATLYVAELEELLAGERSRITPFEYLSNRYFPFLNCDTDGLLNVVWQSRFRQPITHHPRTKEYFILFSSNYVGVGFAYGALEKKSNTPFALWETK